MEAFLVRTGLPPSASLFGLRFPSLRLHELGPVPSEGSSGLFLSEGGW